MVRFMAWDGRYRTEPERALSLGIFGTIQEARRDLRGMDFVLIDINSGETVWDSVTAELAKEEKP